ncbi:hypothetical protein [Moritella sp. Urea-trap-13]|uniref:hypothetical protein n=1 Tax=Moritella sp. Urea-trap-13 TaxID=2058327 RepID=UPI000C33F06C|nr:hypothetical protein [Moritella sp. Urea-trap-13]PKH04855.1 hypothetical protein CXF93_21855 [Moritella sp. Urea-trap-13]
MTTAMNTSMQNTNSQVLTDVELNALRDIFSVNKVSYDINNLMLAGIEPEMLKALLQADSITIIATRGKTEARFPLHLANDGYQNSLQGPQ